MSTYLQRDRSHEQRGDTVSYLPDALFELSCERESVGEGSEPLELREREPSALGPVHGAVHPKVPVVPAHGAGRLPWVELHGIETLAGDVDLGTANAYAVPVLERSVLPTGLEERRQLFRGREAVGE